MRINVITVNYNNCAGLIKTVESVLGQSAFDSYIRYIIVDGGSIDGSNEYLASVKDKLDVLIIEEDEGVYYAMQKGISHTLDGYIIFLNSGDYFYDNHVIDSVISILLKSKVDLFYGTALYYNSRNKLIKWYPNDLSSAFYRIPASHQAIFVNSSLLKQYPLRKEDLRVAADSDFIMYCESRKVNFSFEKDLIVSIIEPNGLSNTERLKSLVELYRCRNFHYPKKIAMNILYSIYIATKIIISLIYRKLFSNIL
jgi:glycosyltransferase involved in cell wall biosynthesis